MADKFYVVVNGSFLRQVKSKYSTENKHESIVDSLLTRNEEEAGRFSKINAHQLAKVFNGKYTLAPSLDEDHVVYLDELFSFLEGNGIDTSKINVVNNDLQN